MIYYFKDREIDLSKNVEVYRNLNEGPGVWWSIRQDGLVVAHAQEVCLLGPKSIVSRSGWNRFKRTGKRNVHAWMRGFLNLSCTADRSTPMTVVYDREKGIFDPELSTAVDDDFRAGLRAACMHLNQRGCSIF